MIVRTATNFFMDIFVVNNFRNFVGEMVFPSELPQILQMENHTKLSTEMNKGIEVTVMVPMQRIDPLVTFLKITEDGTFNLQLSSEYDLLVGSKSVGWTKLWENGSRRTPSFIAEVLKLISDVYILPSKCQDIKLDRQQFLFEVEEIKKLKELRSKTDDEDEKRTLLEDTVGKILLACWRGVEFEIVHVLRKACKSSLYMVLA
ncbi:hypothetical protein EDC04DRAFT_1801711 [Pisolithus marmoratus]|nr:hypothetical protein EDC04DRAFT_1801711 [Pisolithus marmoratus]